MEVVPNFVGRKQNKIIINGVKYKAKENSGCTGCAFGAAGICDQPVTDDGESLCASSRRKDGRSIIWIKKD